jgi:hypothetical protein
VTSLKQEIALFVQQRQENIKNIAKPVAGRRAAVLVMFLMFFLKLLIFI